MYVGKIYQKGCDIEMMMMMSNGNLPGFYLFYYRNVCNESQFFKLLLTQKMRRHKN